MLDGSRVMPVIRQLVATGMAEHVRVNGKRYASVSSGSRYDLPDRGGCERAVPLGQEHVRAARIVALRASQSE